MKPEDREKEFWWRELDRRQILKTFGRLGLLGLVGSAALGGSRELARAMAPSPPSTAVEEASHVRATGEIPKRKLGKTGVEVSALCFGGAHWGRHIHSDTEALHILHEAIDAGVTFLDNAWEYNEGRSEELMGRGIQGRRQQVFLMTKVCSHGRDKKVAMQQLEESLRRLRTDYLDLWQIHEVVYEDDPDKHFMAGGAAEALIDAKRQGKVRFIGFTGHKHPKIHLKMLDYDFPFDTCQMPLNVFDATYRSFEREVLPVVNQRGIAPLAMKTLSGNAEPIKQGVVTPEEALRYVLSLPVATVVSGIDSQAVLKQNLGIVRRFVPMTVAEMDDLRMRMSYYAVDGRFELFKSTNRYEGRIGREQHGIS